jgi:POT family proton-dependent oligopeptide transporter
MNTTRLQQPRQLYLLFFTEMWERFSFYGMKALLLAYMVTQLDFDEPRSYAILGSYTALVYTMPLLGGFMADRFLGFRKAIVFGGILMAIGHLVLAIPSESAFFYGMAFIIGGNGFFKPNISSMVGTLYTEDDPRRDSGFSLFYLGINAGAAMGGLLCGYVGQKINWHYGFGLAGIFMLIGLLVFYLGKSSFGDRGLAPDNSLLRKKYGGIISIEMTIYIGVLVLIPLLVFLLNFYLLLEKIMYGLGLAALIYLISLAAKMDRVSRNKILAALIMIVFSILFWAFYEQNAGSLNLLAIRNVDMHIAGVNLPALSVNNFLPPAWVIILSFAFSRIWLQLGKRGKEPSTPAKFALSFIFLSIGFFVLWLACRASVGNGLIPLWTFIAAYCFIICGELCISPIGLSMITQLSPPRLVGMMMGVWFFATALGEFFAGKIGAMMSVPKNLTNSPVESLPYYQEIIFIISMAALATGLVLALLVPVLKRWTSKTAI